MSTPEQDIQAVQRLRAAQRKLDAAKEAVQAWIDEQSYACRLVTYGEAPGWEAYKVACDEYNALCAEIGRST